MPTRIGLDTNFVVGMLDEQDLWRARTLELQTALEESGFDQISWLKRIAQPADLSP